MFAEGFRIFDNVFAGDECDALIRAFTAGTRSRAGIRNLMSSEWIAAIASDPRLRTICREVVGNELIPFKATLFDKTGKSNWLVAWHQDTALPVEREFAVEGWGPFTKKAGVIYAHAPDHVLRSILALRIHIDASVSSNGPLRVIPGSVHRRISDDAEFRRVVENGPQVELTVGRGGVIAMSPLLIHASSKCRIDVPRRVLHIEYAENGIISRDIRLAVA